MKKSDLKKLFLLALITVIAGIILGSYQPIVNGDVRTGPPPIDRETIDQLVKEYFNNVETTTDSTRTITSGSQYCSY